MLCLTNFAPEEGKERRAGLSVSCQRSPAASQQRAKSEERREQDPSLHRQKRGVGRIQPHDTRTATSSGQRDGDRVESAAVTHKRPCIMLASSSSCPSSSLLSWPQTHLLSL